MVDTIYNKLTLGVSMLKKIFLILLTVFVVNLVSADEIMDLLDEARASYEEDDIQNTISTLHTVLFALEKEKRSTYTEVAFNKLYNSYEKYNGKRIKLIDASISPEAGEAFEDGYRISVSSLTQRPTFWAQPYDKTAMFFVISKKMLKELEETIPKGYVGYFNVYTDKIYTYTESELTRSKNKKYYVARIRKLEILDYNEQTKTTKSSGDFLTD